MVMVVCAGCGRHHRSEHVDACPHCSADRSGVARTAAAVLLGLALGAPGCDFGSQAIYGTPFTKGPDSGETGDTAGPTTTPDDSGDTGV
jgi:hypothetical protein